MNVEVKIDEVKFKKTLRELERKMGDLTPVMRHIGEELLSDWRLLWKEEKDPYERKWADLSPSTKRQKRKRGGYQILVDTGTLLNSFTVEAEKDSVRIGTAVPYAKYHQLGTEKMPQRMLLPDPERLPERNWESIREIIEEWLRV